MKYKASLFLFILAALHISVAMDEPISIKPHSATTCGAIVTMLANGMQYSKNNSGSSIITYTNGVVVTQESNGNKKTVYPLFSPTKHMIYAPGELFAIETDNELTISLSQGWSLQAPDNSQTTHILHDNNKQDRLPEKQREECQYILACQEACRQEEKFLRKYLDDSRTK